MDTEKIELQSGKAVVVQLQETVYQGAQIQGHFSNGYYITKREDAPSDPRFYVRRLLVIKKTQKNPLQGNVYQSLKDFASREEAEAYVAERTKGDYVLMPEAF